MTSITTLLTYYFCVHNDKIITFHASNDISKVTKCHVIIQSNIHALVLLNLLNSLRKEIKCLASLTFYLFSPTCLVNSIKHEHLSLFQHGL